MDRQDESNNLGIIISGEASESEEEELYNNSEFGVESVSYASQRAVTPTKKSELRKETNQQPSLLHNKLWEANVSLRKHLIDDIREPITTYTNKIAKLSSGIPHLHSSAVTANLDFCKSRKNVDLVLDKLSNLDNSILPQARPTSNNFN